jgi:hypothetical protein
MRLTRAYVKMPDMWGNARRNDDHRMLSARTAIGWVLVFSAAIVVGLWLLSLVFQCPADGCHAYWQDDQAPNYYCAIYSVVLCRIWNLNVWVAGILAAYGSAISITIMTAATAAIAVFNLSLSNATKALSAAAEQQKIDTRESINIAGQQMAILASQTDNLIKQKEIMRQEFLSTHRPKIVLREAICGSLLDGSPISVILQLANTGETTGTIVRSRVRVEVVNKENPRPLLHASVELEEDFGSITLAPGEARSCHPKGEMPKWDQELFRTHSQERMNQGSGPPTVIHRWRKTVIHLVGQIIYVDEAGNTPRRTGFRRELDPQRQRFYRIPEEPDLDYED